MPAPLTRARATLLGAERRGRFSLPLLLGDAALAAWLLTATRAFAGHAPAAPLALAAFATGAALLAWVFQMHDFSAGKFRRLLAWGVGLAPALVSLGLIDAATFAEAVWLGAALAALLLALRAAHFAARAAWPDQPLEMARWIFLGGAATALLWPFYRATSLGSGDAYWYAIMLADFTAQLRAGVFPVWAGQSEFAFNGAVSPLRLAPWFQHAGGLLDLATAHALNPAALRNALLAVNALATVFSTYLCLRAVLPRRPGIAALLAALWLASPGVLAAPMLADLLMTFMAMPFLPPVLLGCWRVWTDDGTRARVILAIGLAGALLAHTPVALWCALLAVALCAAKWLARREWRADLGRNALTAVLLALLGAYPVLSVLALDNKSTAFADGRVAADEISRIFPANFLPISTATGASSLQAFQLGYVALAAFALALTLLVLVRPRGAIAFAVATLAVALFVLPVPEFSKFFWTHVPTAFVTINNVWPMQRLFALWALLMFFTLALVLGDERLSRRTWLVTLLLAALAGGGVWSWREAARLHRRVALGYASAESTTRAFASSNLDLTRYAYASFSAPPAYLSHGYMDPLLENRLLDRATLAVLAANADSAAPPVRPPEAPGVIPRLVQTGLLTAVHKVGDVYNLDPALPLAPGKNYALRLEFFRPGRPGLLQCIDAGMFRQYELPDSGAGHLHARPPAAFGSLTSSSHVLPLRPGANTSGSAQFLFTSNRLPGDVILPTDRYVFARYWLYTYQARDLPVQVDSLLPYRARTATARSAWLETPRMWLGGYRATVNGQPAEVRRSPNHLVMIALAPGESRVALAYAPQLWLRAAYWACLTAWLVLLAWLARRVLATARAFPAAA